MAYSLTSAADPRALLAAIVTFATAQGWTIEYNNAATATGNGGQIALSSGNCHVAIGERSASENPVAVTGGSDGRLYAALATSINTGISQYWGHPGSIVTTATDSDRVVINDVLGPMTEVHFFGDGDYILCLVRSTASRWTSFGFGLLDNLGMTTPQCAFLIGEYWEWWNMNIVGGAPVAAKMFNQLIWQGRLTNSNGSAQGSILCFIPDNVVDPSLGFTDGDLMVAATTIELIQNFNQNWGINLNDSVAGAFLDIATGRQTTPGVTNQPTTGGAPLFAVPIIYCPSSLISTYLGDLPGLRLCDVTDIIPGEEREYGSDVYLFAPYKQKGATADHGALVCSSYGHGIAFRKS